MKKLLFTILTFLCFAFCATAQEEQDKTQKQPTPVTQAQVEKDEKMAVEERKKHEEKKKEEKKEAEEKKKNSANNTPSAKKTSMQQGKQ